MRNNRNPDNQPLRNVILAGEILAHVLEHPEHFEPQEHAQFIATWNGAKQRLRDSGLLNQIREAA